MTYFCNLSNWEIEVGREFEAIHGPAWGIETIEEEQMQTKEKTASYIFCLVSLCNSPGCSELTVLIRLALKLRSTCLSLGDGIKGMCL